MRNLSLSIIVALVAGLFPFRVHAGDGVFSHSYNGAQGASVPAAVAQALADFDAATCSNFNRSPSKTVTGPTYSGDTGTEHRWQHTMACNDDSFNTGNTYVWILSNGNECPVGETLNTSTGVCEAPSQCDNTISGKTFLRPVFSGGATGDICHESSQCVMSAGDTTGLANGDLIEYVGTNQSCNAEPEIDVPPQAEQDQCLSDSSLTWCQSPDPSDQNCGTLNGDWICLGSVPDGNCTFFGNGNMACAANATSPPAPDTGTPGNVAPPDNTINHNGNTTNIYNNTTVTGSSAGASGTDQGSQPSEAPEIDLDFSDIIENEPASDSYRGEIDTATGVLGTLGDDVLAEIGDPNDFTGSSTLGTTINNAFGYSSCADIALNAFGNTVTLTCADVSQTRDVLGWIARVIFLLAVFQLLTRGPD